MLRCDSPSDQCCILRVVRTNDTTLQHRGLIRVLEGLTGVRKLYDPCIMRSPIGRVSSRQVDLASGRKTRGCDGLFRLRSVRSLALPISSSSPPVLRQMTRKRWTGVQLAVRPEIDMHETSDDVHEHQIVDHPRRGTTMVDGSEGRCRQWCLRPKRSKAQSKVPRNWCRRI